MKKDDPTVQQVYAEAIANDCVPKWYDGIFGWAWHCMCDDNLHCCDQQCSVITKKSAKRLRIQ